MKFDPNPDPVKVNQEQEDVGELACSAEFSQGCIEPEEQK